MSSVDALGDIVTTINIAEFSENKQQDDYSSGPYNTINITIPRSLVPILYFCLLINPNEEHILTTNICKDETDFAIEQCTIKESRYSCKKEYLDQLLIECIT